MSEIQHPEHCAASLQHFTGLRQPVLHEAITRGSHLAVEKGSVVPGLYQRHALSGDDELAFTREDVLDSAALPRGHIHFGCFDPAAAANEALALPLRRLCVPRAIAACGNTCEHSHPDRYESCAAEGGLHPFHSSDGLHGQSYVERHEGGDPSLPVTARLGPCVSLEAYVGAASGGL